MLVNDEVYMTRLTRFKFAHRQAHMHIISRLIISDLQRQHIRLPRLVGSAICTLLSSLAVVVL
jgi:hypothetical protein